MLWLVITAPSLNGSTQQPHLTTPVFGAALVTASNAEAAGAQRSESHPPKTHRTVHPRTPTETVAWAPA